MTRQMCMQVNDKFINTQNCTHTCTDTDTDKHRQSLTHRQAQTQTDRQAQTDTDRQTSTDRHWQTHRQAQTDTDRHIDTDRHRDKQLQWLTSATWVWSCCSDRGSRWSYWSRLCHRWNSASCSATHTSVSITRQWTITPDILSLPALLLVTN